MSGDHLDLAELLRLLGSKPSVEATRGMIGRYIEACRMAADEITSLQDRLEKAEAERKEWLNKAVEYQGFHSSVAGERNRAQAQVAALRSLVEEYYQKTPLGHQPHMISQRVEDALSNTAQAAADHDRRVRSEALIPQPISTAPKDGTPILVGHEHATFIAWWWQEHEIETETGAPGWVNNVTNNLGEQVVYKPTHWAPLPDLSGGR